MSLVDALQFWFARRAADSLLAFALLLVALGALLMLEGALWAVSRVRRWRGRPRT